MCLANCVYLVYEIGSLFDLGSQSRCLKTGKIFLPPQVSRDVPYLFCLRLLLRPTWPYGNFGGEKTMYLTKYLEFEAMHGEVSILIIFGLRY